MRSSEKLRNEEYPLPRPRNIERTIKFGCWIPEALHARLVVEAYSPHIGKVPPRGLTSIVSDALTLYFDVKDGRRSIV